eukprot:CAMPEP_0202767184 /NCGR_PEP_ID=MMETSP1388-20130828/32182_1 /ASSEMBLY_ACC=CAM_ASM_000864 /TAXON_ID=37098 /ORGANISM="Isochrysis sp, Strain CCMP1244" /LENGTH=47 /DNA_ID= /DNA_START= /DNA_END= /DNA_ORIENTATION=
MTLEGNVAGRPTRVAGIPRSALLIPCGAPAPTPRPSWEAAGSTGPLR